MIPPTGPTAPRGPWLQGFRGGEGFAFTFSVGAIDAGRARISVGDAILKDGRHTVSVLADAHSAPWLALLARLDDDYKVTLDADALAPRELHIVEKGLRERTLDMILDKAVVGTRVKVDSVRPKEQRHELHSVVGEPLEPAAALFTMRAAPWRIGDSIEFIAFDGPSFYKTTATAAKRDVLERQGERQSVIRLDVVAVRIDDAGRDAGQPPRHATIWLSDDDKRVPYRVAGDTDFGRCELELVSYREGREPTIKRGGRPAGRFVKGDVPRATATPVAAAASTPTATTATVTLAPPPNH